MGDCSVECNRISDYSNNGHNFKEGTERMELVNTSIEPMELVDTSSAIVLGKKRERGGSMNIVTNTNAKHSRNASVSNEVVTTKSIIINGIPVTYTDRQTIVKSIEENRRVFKSTRSISLQFAQPVHLSNSLNFEQNFSSVKQLTV